MIMIVELETIIGGGVLVFMALFYFSTKSNNLKEKAKESNRIPDEKVSVKRLKKDLKKLILKKETRLKFGYTETSIRGQLDKQLRVIYESVQQKYVLEGNNGFKIDFNIGKGSVGIEIKLAKSVFKATGLQQLVGQLKDYTDSKYDNRNLIVLVAGEQHYLQDRVQLDKVRRRILDEGAHFVFLEVEELIL